MHCSLQLFKNIVINCNEKEGLLFDCAGVWTGGALFTGSSVGSRLSALTNPTLTAAAAAAQQADAGHAGVCAGGAVTVFTFPAGVTHAGSTVTLPVI